jgi:hypothetical protein
MLIGQMQPAIRIGNMVQSSQQAHQMQDPNHLGPSGIQSAGLHHKRVGGLSPSNLKKIQQNATEASPGHLDGSPEFLEGAPGQSEDSYT